jgi:hypothetical protein
MAILKGPVSQPIQPLFNRVGRRLPIRRKTVISFRTIGRLFEGNITVSHLHDALAPVPPPTPFAESLPGKDHNRSWTVGRSHFGSKCELHRGLPRRVYGNLAGRPIRGMVT